MLALSGGRVVYMKSGFGVSLLGLMVAAGVGCRSRAPAPDGATEGTASTAQAALVVREDAAPLIAQFQQQLQEKLLAAMAQGGPSAAIDVCAKQAPEIARNAGNEQFRLRRIGTRTRNANNRPTEFDRAALAQLSQAEPGHEAAGAYYQAIFMQPLCLTCHGDRATLSPEVSSALARSYPADEAVGYQVGELRGAFVVERK